MDKVNWGSVQGTFRTANYVNRLTREKEKQMAARPVKRSVARALARGRRTSKGMVLRRQIADKRDQTAAAKAASEKTLHRPRDLHDPDAGSFAD